MPSALIGFVDLTWTRVTWQERQLGRCLYQTGLQVIRGALSWLMSEVERPSPLWAIWLLGRPPWSYRNQADWTMKGKPANSIALCFKPLLLLEFLRWLPWRMDCDGCVIQSKPSVPNLHLVMLFITGTRRKLEHLLKGCSANPVRFYKTHEGTWSSQVDDFIVGRSYPTVSRVTEPQCPRVSASPEFHNIRQCSLMLGEHETPWKI